MTTKRYDWFESRRQEFISTHSGKLANTRAFIEYCKSKMKPKTWEKYKHILDIKYAHLPHHRSKTYDPIKAKQMRKDWTLARYEFMYGPLKCKTCGATHGPLFDTLREKTAIRILVRHDYCSEHCSKSSIEARTKRESTTMKRYGVKNVTYIPEVMDKIKKYNRDPDNIKKKQEKTNQTIIKKYGSLDAFYKIQAKKRLPTVQKRYGGNAPTCHPKVKEKVRNTLRKHYGVDTPMQSPTIVAKLARVQQHAHKTVTVEGKVFKNLQGAEPFFLTWFAKNAKIYSINDIFKGGLHIEYTYKGEQHMYYPDFVIPKAGIVIEVKSPYTTGYNKIGKVYDYYKNKAKSHATVQNGYKYIFAVCDYETKKDVFLWKGRLPGRKVFKEKLDTWLFDRK